MDDAQFLDDLELAASAQEVRDAAAVASSGSQSPRTKTEARDVLEGLLRRAEPSARFDLLMTILTEVYAKNLTAWALEVTGRRLAKPDAMTAIIEHYSGGGTQEAAPGEAHDDHDVDEDGNDDEEGTSMTVERLDAKDLIDHLENAPNAEVRGVVFELPSTSLRSEQPLFPHQAMTLSSLEANQGASGIVHLPTGAGKTRVAIDLIAKRLASGHDRVIWATYPTILIRQAMLRVAELAAVFPRGTRILWSEANMRDPDLLSDAHITFLMREDLTGLLDDAGDGRVAGPALLEALAGRHPSGCQRVTLVYDECHQLGAERLQQAWRKFCRKVGRPDLLGRFQTIGFSATPIPTDPARHRLLQEDIFPVRNKKTAKPEWHLLVHASIENKQLVAQEILCPVNSSLQDSGVFNIPDAVLRAAGADGIRAPGRNPSKDDLIQFAEQFNNRVLSHDAALRFLSDRLAANSAMLGKTLVFVPTIAAANRLAQMLKNDSRVGSGKVTVVHSKLDEFSGDLLDDDESSATDVQRQVEAFKKRGDAACFMINVGMLTTGFDDPKIRTVVLARLTFSTNLFWQMVGRGTRGLRCGGTKDCFVIDPIRLGDRFDFLNGYRPALAGTGYTEIERRSDDIGQGALAPQVPTVQGAPVDMETIPAIPPDLRRDLAEALAAFLRGGALDPNLASALSVQLSKDGDRVTTKFVPTASLPPGTPSSPQWMPDLAVTLLEQEFRESTPTADLSWLRTTQHLPASTSKLDLDVFQKKLDLIRKHKIMTEQQFMKLLLERLS